MVQTEKLSQRLQGIKLRYGLTPYQMLINEGEWKTQDTYTERYDKPQDKPGVYFFLGIKEADLINEMEILYIGSSNKIKSRKAGHTAPKKFKGLYDEVHFYFKYCDNYLKEERRLIKQYNPKFNIYG